MYTQIDCLSKTISNDQEFHYSSKTLIIDLFFILFYDGGAIEAKDIQKLTLEEYEIAICQFVKDYR